MAQPFADSAVPQGSTLTIEVTGQGDPDQDFFVAHGLFQLPDQSHEEWVDSEIRSGLSRQLDLIGSYAGQLDLHFLKQSTARIRMDIQDPAGNSVASYDQQVAQSSDLDRTFILLIVR